jgi:phage terminase small subunit
MTDRDNKLIKTNSVDKTLTLKRRKFLKCYFETGNATLAAKQAFDCKSIESANSMGSEYLRVLKSPIKAYMESKGLSLGYLVEKIREGADATRPTNASILISKDGKVEKAEEQGLIEVPDYAVRHKYVETAAKWLGIQGEERIEGESGKLRRRIVAEEFFDVEETNED